MFKKFLSCLFLGLVLLAAVPLWADDFYVIGGGGTRIGTKITSLPYSIKNSGFYFLAVDLTTSWDGITVEADHVTIDLMDFSLIYRMSFGIDNNSTGIYLSGRTNVEIRNGTIRGFYVGIYEYSSTASGHCISNVRLFNPGSGDSGVSLRLEGNNHLVQNCLVANHGRHGIRIHSGTISGCQAYGNGRDGIRCDYGSIINCTATNNGEHGISSSSGIISGCGADGNGWGISLGEGTIINCVATNNTNTYSTGHGISLDKGSIINCVAMNNTNKIGIAFSAN